MFKQVLLKKINDIRDPSAPPNIVRIRTMDVAKHISGLVQAICIRKNPLLTALKSLSI